MQPVQNIRFVGKRTVFSSYKLHKLLKGTFFFEGNIIEHELHC